MRGSDALEEKGTVHIRPEGGHHDTKTSDGKVVEFQGSGKKESVEEIAIKADAMSDEELTKHLYQLFLQLNLRHQMHAGYRFLRQW